MSTTSYGGQQLGSTMNSNKTKG